MIQQSVGGQASISARGRAGQASFEVGERIQARKGSSATAPYFDAVVTSVDARTNRFDYEFDSGYAKLVPGERAVSRNKLRKRGEGKGGGKGGGGEKKWRPRGAGEFVR